MGFFSLNARDAEIEAELPSSLRLIGAELNINTPFEEVLRNACDGGTAFHDEMRRVAREVDAGASIPSALAGMAERSKSLHVKRTASALAWCYSRGENGEALKRLASEFSRMQKAKLKEHAARASMLGLAFISIACILPSLFLALVVVGSSFMQEMIPLALAWIVFILVLPLILTTIITLAWISTPVFARGRSGMGGNAEKFLPDALLHASSVDARGFEEMTQSIARADYGELSREFGLACKRIESGEPFASAVRGIGRKLGSPLVGRACNLIAKAYESGADLGEAMREAADDAVELFSAEKEKAALLATQRYTLYAGIILVPVILGFIVRAVSGLDYSNAEELGLNQSGGEALSEGVKAASTYLALFACASALFLAVQEGMIRKSIGYATVFTPIALTVFFLSSNSIPAIT